MTSCLHIDCCLCARCVCYIVFVYYALISELKLAAVRVPTFLPSLINFVSVWGWSVDSVQVMATHLSSMANPVARVVFVTMFVSMFCVHHVRPNGAHVI